jgi:sugar phosphate isomerase/epimerase
MPNDLRIGLVTEALIKWPLPDVMDWLEHDVPEITDLEIGTGAYAPTQHCDMHQLLADKSVRAAWQREIVARGFRIAALNAWGNPLHPDVEIAQAHDKALRDTITLAAALGVDRIVAMAGCPAGAPGDVTPVFAAGGWLPYLENAHLRQWQDVTMGYWRNLSEFAQRTHPGLLICLELHPGTVAYNVESFEQLAGLSPMIAANIDPSHFFWMGMDTGAVVDRLAGRVGHAHAKDVVFNTKQLALNGLLDRRWPMPPEEMPWTFATVGSGHDAHWWHGFKAQLATFGRARTIAIEHEDPFVAPELGIKAAAKLLAVKPAAGTASASPHRAME